MILAVDHRSCGNCVFLKERNLLHMGPTSLSGSVLYVPVPWNPSVFFDRCCCVAGRLGSKKGKWCGIGSQELQLQPTTSQQGTLRHISLASWSLRFLFKMSFANSTIRDSLFWPKVFLPAKIHILLWVLPETTIRYLRKVNLFKNRFWKGLLTWRKSPERGERSSQHTFFIRTNQLRGKKKWRVLTVLPCQGKREYMSPQ